MPSITSGLAVILVVLAGSAAFGSPAEPKTVLGKVTDVTLYRGQAQLVRTIPLANARVG